MGCCCGFSPPSYPEEYDREADIARGRKKYQFQELKRLNTEARRAFYERLYKVLLLGGPLSGKQTLLQTWAKQQNKDIELIPEQTRPCIVFASIRAQFEMIHQLAVDCASHSGSDFDVVDAEWFEALSALLSDDKLFEERGTDCVLQLAAIWRLPSFKRFLDEYIGAELRIEHVFRPLRHFFGECTPLRLAKTQVSEYSPTQLDLANSKVLTDGFEYVKIADDCHLFHYPLCVNRFDTRFLLRMFAEAFEFEYVVFTLDVSVYDCRVAETKWTTVCAQSGELLKFPKCELVLGDENALEFQTDVCFQECCERFRNTSVIFLVLTKVDIFEEKLKSVPFDFDKSSALSLDFFGDPQLGDDCREHVREYCRRVYESSGGNVEFRSNHRRKRRMKRKLHIQYCDLRNEDEMEQLRQDFNQMVTRVNLKMSMMF